MITSDFNDMTDGEWMQIIHAAYWEGEFELVEWAASNPSTPINRLVVLVAYRADLVWQNPAWLLESVANSRLIDSLDRSQMTALVGSKFAPLSVVRKYGTDKGQPQSVRAAAAGNPIISREMMVGYLEHGQQVRIGLASNPTLPVEFIDFLFSDPAPEVLLSLLGNALVPTSILDRLRGYYDPCVSIVNKKRWSDHIGPPHCNGTHLLRHDRLDSLDNSNPMARILHNHPNSSPSLKALITSWAGLFDYEQSPTSIF